MEKNENKDKNKSLIIKFCSLLNDFFAGKDNIDLKVLDIEDENIEKYFQVILYYCINKKISKDDLPILFKALDFILQNNCQILIPFINDIIYYLIKEYIDSDFDQDIKFNENIIENNKDISNNLDYLQIFKKFIHNFFIDKKSIIYIYNYFAKLYYLGSSINQDSLYLNKLKKVFELFLIFYTLPKIGNTVKLSSFFLLGTGLKVTIDEKPSKIDSFIIDISLQGESFLKYINPNNKLFSFNENNFIDYSKIILIDKDKIENKKNSLLIGISFIFNNKNEILVNPQYTDTVDEDYLSYGTKFTDEINNFDNISLLEGFIGEITKIRITITNNFERLKYDYEIKPFHTNKLCNKFDIKTTVRHMSMEKAAVKKKLANLQSKDKEKENIITLKLEPDNEALFIDNYINYNEKDFNIVNYYNGIENFLPFLGLIKLLYENEKIIKINGTQKNEYLEYMLSKCILQLTDIKNSKFYETHLKDLDDLSLFFAYFMIFTTVIFKNLNFQINKSLLADNLNTLQLSNSTYNDLLTSIYSNWLNDSNLKSNPNIETLLEEGKYTFSQYYRHIMKELFIYNRMWSLKEVFFENNRGINKEIINNDILGNVIIKNDSEDNNVGKIKVKYKQLNYLTKNFQKPILYPILEINNYYPNFLKFKPDENLYTNINDKILNYDFSINDNYILEEKNENEIKANQNLYLCCLIKKSHHIKGYIKIYFNDKINEQSLLKDLILIYKSFRYEDIDKYDHCNVGDKEKKENICFNSFFKPIKKECNRIININSNEIEFLLLRNQLYKLSGIEIFTINKKCYYFNFKEEKALNEILDYFSKLENFKEINYINKANKTKRIGYYNLLINTKISLNFKNSINSNLDLKNLLNSNYDKIIYANIFSNRSLNDLNQYPVFPTLYFNLEEKNIDCDNASAIIEKRMFDQTIGFQDFTDKAFLRKNIFINEYNLVIEEKKAEVDKEDLAVLEVFYSNSTFISSYLIRVFPYSFFSIEIQGNGFDDPNRQFTFINSLLENTLTQKSDLREFIPELYYFEGTYFNFNELNLGKKTTDIVNDVDILTKNEKDRKIKYNFMSKLRNILEYKTNISDWINLIFGIYQVNTKENYKLYPDRIKIEYCTNEKFINDSLTKKLSEFGVLPIQIYFEKYPEIQSLNKCLVLISILDNKFKNSHKLNLDKPKETFIYNFNNSFDNDYLQILESCFKSKSKIINKKNFNISLSELIEKEIKKLKNNNLKKKYSDIIDFKKNNVYSYSDLIPNELNNNLVLIGDIFGKVRLVKKTSDILSENNFYDEPTIIELNDHSDCILYIDYNSYLNMMISYGNDNYINLYTLPKFKLLRAIKLDNIINFVENENMQLTALISYPFPLILLVTNFYFYTLSINGELISQEKRYKNTLNDLYIGIDPVLGLFGDFIYEINSLDRQSFCTGFRYLFPKLNKIEEDLFL